MNNNVFVSILAGILFGFSALLMFFRADEPVSVALLSISGILMFIYAWRIRNKKNTDCNLNSGQNEN